MDIHYRKINTLLINTLWHTPICLIDIIQSYIAYPSVDLNTWLNDSKNEHNKHLLKLFNYNSQLAIINPNYNTRKHVLAHDEHSNIVMRTNYKLESTHIDHVYDSWIHSNYFLILVSIKPNAANCIILEAAYKQPVITSIKDIILKMRSKTNIDEGDSVFMLTHMSLNHYHTIIKLSKSIEQLYIFTDYETIKDSKIKMIDYDDCGFLPFSGEMKNYCLKIINPCSVSMESIDQVYYLKKRGERKYFIIRLNDGRWLSSDFDFDDSEFSPNSEVFSSCLSSAIMNCLGNDRRDFVDCQIEMLLNASV